MKSVVKSTSYFLSCGGALGAGTGLGGYEVGLWTLWTEAKHTERQITIHAPYSQMTLVTTAPWWHSTLRHRMMKRSCNNDSITLFSYITWSVRNLIHPSSLGPSVSCSFKDTNVWHSFNMNTAWSSKGHLNGLMLKNMVHLKSRSNDQFMQPWSFWPSKEMFVSFVCRCKE